MNLRTEKEYQIKKLLDDVMVRLEKQFLDPATYTLKRKSEEDVDLHVFLHGCSASHYSHVDFVWDMVSEFEDHLRKVNEVSDYFIEFFIKALNSEAQMDAIEEIVANLEFVYEQTVQAKRWYDEDAKTFKVSFIPFKPEFVVTLDADQVVKEYNERFSSEDAADILVDLSKISKEFNTNGFLAASKFVKDLNRSIEIEKPEDSKKIKDILFG